MTARGGLHLIRALDAAQFPIDLELEEGVPLGLGEIKRELVDEAWMEEGDFETVSEATLHRLDRAGFAECGSKVDECVTVADAADDWDPVTYHLCWYCFPRG